MRRIEKLLNNPENIRYPDDVALLKEEIPELRSLSDGDVQLLYEEYSEVYAAGWLMVDEDSIYCFRLWLTEEV